MDAEAWNAKIREMNGASRRAARMGALSETLQQAAEEARELGAPALAEQLYPLIRETFHPGALAQQREADVMRELEAARAAEEKPVSPSMRATSAPAGYGWRGLGSWWRESISQPELDCRHQNI
jgi:hypothetical protein